MDSSRLLDVPLPPTRWLPAVRAVTRRAMARRYGVGVVGADVVPTSGPVILASNHVGYVDGPLLFAVAPRPMHALVNDVQRTKPGAAYLALVTGAPVVPVACLGTRPSYASTDSRPLRGSRLDVVFGAPLRVDAVGRPRTSAQVAAVQAEIQAVLAEHVRVACESTGQVLPALPTSADVAPLGRR